MQKLPFILLGLGAVALFTSGATWFGVPLIFGRTLQIDPEVGPERWTHNNGTTENFLKIHFFNVTNPEKVVEGQKPTFEDIGPYVYQFRLTPRIDSPEPHDTIVLTENEKYYFRPDLSGGKETDVVTIINLPFVGFAQEVSKMSSFYRLMVMGVVSRFNEGMFSTKTAKQHLFGGYKQELLATFSAITGEKYMENNTFGYFYERNNSNIGEFTLSTGIHDQEALGQIVKWNGKSKVKWWKDETCGRISGTYDGTIFPRGVITKDSILTIFEPLLCRTFKYAFMKEISHHGVSGYRFKFLTSNLEDPRTRPENMCYCTHPGENGEDCPKNGSFQLNACLKGASISVSLPHFLYGSDEYIDSAYGYHPDEMLHESFIDIDPVTGILLKKVKRTQINLHIKPLKFFRDFQKIPKMLFPCIWAEEARELTFSAIKELTNGSSQVLVMSVIAQIALGSLLVLLSMIIILLRLKKDRAKYNT